MKRGTWPERELNASGRGLEEFQHLCKRCDRLSLVIPLMMLTCKDLNSLDQWSDEKGALQPRDLRDVAQRAQELIDVIKRIREMPFVNELAMSGQMSAHDLLNWRCNPDEKFETLLKLPEYLVLIGPRRKPDFNETLDHLTQYVEAQWHKPMFTSIEEVLNGLGVSVNLKQRKYDRRATTSKGKNKRQKL